MLASQGILLHYKIPKTRLATSQRCLQEHFSYCININNGLFLIIDYTKLNNYHCYIYLVVFKFILVIKNLNSSRQYYFYLIVKLLYLVIKIIQAQLLMVLINNHYLLTIMLFTSKDDYFLFVTYGNLEFINKQKD